MPGDGRGLPAIALDCSRRPSYGRQRLDISGPGGALTPRGPAPRNWPRCTVDCSAASRFCRAVCWRSADRGRLLGSPSKGAGPMPTGDPKPRRSHQAAPEQRAAVSDGLVLAAVDRAYRHGSAEGRDAPIWSIIAHLAIAKRTKAAREVRSRLRALEADGLLEKRVASPWSHSLGTHVGWQAAFGTRGPILLPPGSARVAAALRGAMLSLARSLHRSASASERPSRRRSMKPCS